MRRVLAAATVAAAVGGVIAAPPVLADDAHTAVVSANPVDYTPHAVDGRVRGFAMVGNKVVVGGSFTAVRNANSTTQLSQPYVFAFDRATGKIDTAFAPKLNGQVWGVAPGPDGTVFVGGAFTTVNGATNKGLVKLNLQGGRVGTFGISSGHVRDVIVRQNQLYVGGQFSTINGVTRQRIARLDATTGTVDPDFNFNLSTPMNNGALRVYDMALSPDGAKLVATGSFTKVNGQTRSQVAMFGTGAGTATLSSWATSRYGDVCSSSFDSYIRDVDFDPTGSYFVIVTTGGPGGPTRLCDTAARWNAGATGSGQQPTWVNFTGGDTLLSVSVTGVAVYVGGHQRWLDNPYGSDFAGPGAVYRPGIGAIHPTTGKALSWNPTRTRGYGAENLEATPDGYLFVGSDTDQLGKEFHGKLGAFPPV